MNVLRQIALATYYTATQPARRRAAIDRAARQTEPVRILFYHRVADRHPNAWTISTRTFARQLHWLRERFDLVHLSEAQQRIAAGRNRWPTACITFDDGYEENCDFAIPLLMRQQVPFTYFMSTNHVLGGQPFPHDVTAGLPLPPNTPEQLREMVRQGVEVGCHSRSHADLGAITSTDVLREEIGGAKGELEAALASKVRYFAFPFGLEQNLSAEAFRIAREAGYQGVLSAYGGYNFPGDDPFHLRRFHADPEMIRLKNWMSVDPRKVRHDDVDWMEQASVGSGCVRLAS